MKKIRKRVIKKLILGAIELRFNFADHNSREEIKDLMRHNEYAANLEEIYRLVRSKLKHGVTAHLKQEDINMLEEIRNLSAVTMSW